MPPRARGSGDQRSGQGAPAAGARAPISPGSAATGTSSGLRAAATSRTLRRMLHTLLTLSMLAAPSVEIPHQRFTLDNGLVVILHVDRRVPLVTVNLNYDVGSKDEPPGRTGFAHLFEHLMFMGTERAPQGKFDTWMEAEGAWNNAWTSEDRTDYYAVGPTHTLPLLLWLEADRLSALGGQIDQKKLDLQRDVVRNERRQTSENTPYGVAYLTLPGMLYPEGHPYHHPVIGSHADLQAATVKDVRDFFDAWYVAGNASLVVAGDFDPTATRAEIERLFGWLPAREPPRAVPADPRPPQPAAVTAPKTLEDRVDQPRVIFAWQSPAHFEPGDAALDVLADVLADGKASLLFQDLVFGQEVAQDVYAGQWSGRLGSQFVVWATARPGVDVDRLQAALEASLAKAIEQVDAEGVARARAKAETGFVQQLQAVHNRASLLNTYQSLKGRPDFVAEDLARYATLTAEDVKVAAAPLLTPARRATLRVVPKAAEGGAQ